PVEIWAGIEVGAFSPDGRTLVTKEGYDLHVRDAATGTIRRSIKGPRTNAWSRESLEFTPDGKAIAVTSQGKFIHLIDFDNGKTIRDFSVDNPESALGPGWTSV